MIHYKEIFSLDLLGIMLVLPRSWMSGDTHFLAFTILSQVPESCLPANQTLLASFFFFFKEMLIYFLFYGTGD
jgi:hypothetical protein